MANTNPALAALPDAMEVNLHTIHFGGFFNVKQNLLQINNYYNTQQRARSSASECMSDKDLFDEFEGQISEFSDEDDREMMLDFIHLRPSGN